jgi:type IV pilus assembly protein PilC
MSGIDISKFKTSSRPVKKEKPGQGILDFLNKDISFSGSRLKDVQRESFYMELSILLEAGVDIKSAFELIATEQRKPSVQKLFHSIKDFVIAGGTLSEALRHTGAFSNYEYFSVQIGEETGKIITVLNDLAAFYKNKTRQRRQIIGALTYPAIVLLTSFGAIFFMLNFIVPMFSDIFKRFGGKLPYITQSIIHVSNFLKANGGVAG